MSSGASAGGEVSETARGLLRCGVWAGPVYLVVGLAQALVRDGFDLARHPLSLLANGSGGWIQTANLLLTGVAVVAAAVGLGRVLGAKSRGVTWPLAGFGLGMVVAALFPADPMDGFPPGTPLGFPTSISTTGLVHFASGALGFTLLGISCLVAARVLSRRGLNPLARLSSSAGAAVLLGFYGGMVLPIGVAGIWMAVIAGWSWLTALSLRLGGTRAAG